MDALFNACLATNNGWDEKPLTRRRNRGNVIFKIFLCLPDPEQLTHWDLGAREFSFTTISYHLCFVIFGIILRANFVEAEFFTVILS